MAVSLAGFDFKQADCSTAAEGYLKVSWIKMKNSTRQQAADGTSGTARLVDGQHS
jgi:hypothetical protein